MNFEFYGDQFPEPQAIRIEVGHKGTEQTKFSISMMISFLSHKPKGKVKWVLAEQKNHIQYNNWQL